MSTEADPIISTWYQHLDKGQKFQVVAIDENGCLIEVQHFDGDIEEIDIDDWYSMDLEQIESPENISGALDVSEIDDLGASVTDTNAADWNAPMQELSGYDGEEVIMEQTEGTVELTDDILYEESWDEI